MTDKDKTRTITLSDRAPVTIREADWPTIASAAWGDGEVPSQHNRAAALRVRQHRDGRALVYAVYRSAWQREDDYRGGELIEAPGAGASVCDRGADIDAGLSPGVQTMEHGGCGGRWIVEQPHDALPAAIRRVGERAAEYVASDRWHRLIEECIADLPAEDLP